MRKTLTGKSDVKRYCRKTSMSKRNIVHEHVSIHWFREEKRDRWTFLWNDCRNVWHLCCLRKITSWPYNNLHFCKYTFHFVHNQKFEPFPWLNIFDTLVGKPPKILYCNTSSHSWQRILRYNSRCFYTNAINAYSWPGFFISFVVKLQTNLIVLYVIKADWVERWNQFQFCVTHFIS